MNKLVQTYFKLWEEQKSEGLREIFDPDAIYRVKPFGEEEYFGIDAITSYWENNPIKKQTNPNPRILNIVSNDNIVFIEWVNNYQTLEGKSKETRGILILEIHNDLITELREFYKSVTL